MDSPPIPTETDSRLITCILPKGAGIPLLESLHNYGLTTANFYYSRGSDVGDPIDRSGMPIQTQKEIVTVVVSGKNADEMFEFVIDHGRIDRPNGGFVYMAELRKSVPFVLPEIKDPARIELTAEKGLSIPTEEDTKLITCILPKGGGKSVMEALHQRGLTTGNLCYARGSNVGSPVDRRGLPIQEEREIVTVVVSKEDADDIFLFIAETAQIDQPDAGFMYMDSLRRSVPFVLPDLPPETKSA